MVEVLEVFETCSLMFPVLVLALDDRDTISNRTRRHCVLCIDGMPRCRPAVQVAVRETSGKICSELLGVVIDRLINMNYFLKLCSPLSGGVIVLCGGPSLSLQFRLVAADFFYLQYRKPWWGKTTESKPVVYHGRT